MLDSRHRRSPIATVRAEFIEGHTGRLVTLVKRVRDRSIHRDADRLLFRASVEIIVAIGKAGYRPISKLPVRTIENGVQYNHLASA